jgi:hypothetical protein
MVEENEMTHNVAGERNALAGLGEALDPVDAPGAVALEHLAEKALVDPVAVLKQVDVDTCASVLFCAGEVLEAPGPAAAAERLDCFAASDAFDDVAQDTGCVAVVAVDPGYDDVALDGREVEKGSPLAGFGEAADRAVPATALEGGGLAEIGVPPGPEPAGLWACEAFDFVPVWGRVETVEEPLDEGFVVGSCLR